MAYGRERVPQILLVEDDEGDALLTEKALSKGPVAFDLHHVETGADALAFVEAWAPRPDLILLDLNLPGIHGTEVLTAAPFQPSAAPARRLRRISYM